MNIGIGSLVEEIIINCLEANGVSIEVINKAIDEIHYNCKETNFMNNEVANSNYFAAEERKESEKIKRLQKEAEQREREFSEKQTELYDTIRRQRNKIEELVEKIND